MIHDSFIQSKMIDNKYITATDSFDLRAGLWGSCANFKSTSKSSLTFLGREPFDPIINPIQLVEIANLTTVSDSFSNRFYLKLL